ncbi:MAG: lactonase family protein [Dehalococcoidia bacterium]
MGYFVYVSVQREDKIAILSMDPASGRLQPQGEVPVASWPAPLAVDPGRNFLFAGRRKPEEFGLASFSVDQATGHLSPISAVPLQGDPTHLSTDRTGKFLLSAYYYQQKVAVHGIDGGGVLNGTPIEWLDTDYGAHYVQTDPSNHYALVPHIADGSLKGPNAIFQFKFDGSTGQLTANTPPRLTPQEPEGPRHLCFHPSLDIVYTSNEQGCSVSAYNFDPAKGTLAPVQTVPTLPEDYNGANSCSQIQITPSGKFLYAPNRGHNSIACFAVDAAGRLTPGRQVPTEPIPRAFSIDPQGKFLYAAGLESGRLASYRIDESSGNLEPLEIYDVGQGPMWVLITEL